MSIGSKYTQYFNVINAWSGYNANEKIADEGYQPSPTADKGFFLLFKSKDTLEDITGNAETTQVDFDLKVLFQFKKSVNFSAFQAATWTLIDTAEKALFAYAETIGDILHTGTITLDRKGNGDYWICTIPGELVWTRSLA